SDSDLYLLFQKFFFSASALILGGWGITAIILNSNFEGRDSVKTNYSWLTKGTNVFSPWCLYHQVALKSSTLLMYETGTKDLLVSIPFHSAVCAVQNSCLCARFHKWAWLRYVLSDPLALCCACACACACARNVIYNGQAHAMEYNIYEYNAIDDITGTASHLDRYIIYNQKIGYITRRGGAAAAVALAVVVAGGRFG
ncbi:hypothetical protein ACJX0J_006084, partial [Zea mays]